MNIANQLTKKEEERKLLEARLNESTAFSWLWALCFGPLWFWYIGAGKWALGALLAAIATGGVATLAFPFFAYAAHRSVARRKFAAIDAQVAALDAYLINRNNQ